MTVKLYTDKPLKIAYWNQEKRLVNAEKLQLEQYLKILGDIDLSTIDTLEHPNVSTSDLIIITADHVPEKDFIRWLRGLSNRFTSAELIWKPALILSDVPYKVWAEDWLGAVKSNWYFDIVSKDHLDSIPIRAGNLLKIHDHLHELQRYATMVGDLQKKVTSIEQQLIAAIGSNNQKNQ